MIHNPENLNKLAFQSNALVRSKLRFTRLEAKIFTLALALVHKNANELPPINIDMRNVIDGDMGGQNYKLIKEAMDGLSNKTASVEKITNKRSKYTNYSLIDTLDFDTGTGMLTGLFSQSITPFLLQLRGNFTRGEIQTLLLLDGAHTHRLYWILKSWDDVGSCTYKFEALREMILGEHCGNSYAIYTDFKRHVLEPAIAELNSLQPPWPVSYDVKKRGKKVEEIVFTIPKYELDNEEEVKPVVDTVKKTLTFEQIQQFREYLTNKDAQLTNIYDQMQTVFRLSEFQARIIIHYVVKSPELELQYKRLLGQLRKVSEAIRLKHPMKSVPAYTLTMVKEIFPVFTKSAK